MLAGHDIICFAPTEWWGMNPSCTTHMMRKLAQKNKILYVNPFSSDLLGERKSMGRRIPRKIKSIAQYLNQPEKNLFVFSPVFLPVQGIKIADSLNNVLLKIQLRVVCSLIGMERPILWVENLRAADMLDWFDSKTTVFHVSDLFSKSRYVGNKEKLLEREDRIIKKSNLVICVSQSLYKIKSAHHDNVFYLPHAVDFDLFREAVDKNVRLEEVVHIPKPIAGYYGTMTANNDIELLLYCARHLPKVSFVLAGQITSGDYSQLAQLPNVYLLGKIPYEKIPSLCASFDVCMLQWKMTEWIRSCNPLKMMEYMASGKPIVSVPIDEVVNRYSEVVSIASGRQEFCDSIVWELENDTAERSSRRIEIAKEHSWNNHIEEISKRVTAVIHPKRSSPERNTGYQMGVEHDRMKICITASAGGHLTQLLKLSESWQDYETFCVTTSDVVREKLQKYGKAYSVGECNREHPFRVILVLFRCIRVILYERPNVVISTGAAVGCIMCFLGKLLGAKVVWIDSIANVERVSLSGRMVRHIADLFLVQWPELAEQYNNVEYLGAAI